MNQFVRTTLIKAIALGGIAGGIAASSLVAQAEQSLSVVYPPKDHETNAEQIFLIGTAPGSGDVMVNGEKIKRSPQGHFAPSFPLQIGENKFQLEHKQQKLEVTVTRLSNEPELLTKATFAPNSLIPATDITKQPGESICFSAIAPPEAEVSVGLGGKFIPLLPQSESVTLPPNSGVLVNDNAPDVSNISGQYQGCTEFDRAGNFGKPEFEVNLRGDHFRKNGEGAITIAKAQDLEVVEVTADNGVARTGASTNFSRLTPLPKGTRARVTGKEGAWLRLDYGAWIKAEETKTLPPNSPIQSLIRSITSRQIADTTEIIFPLQVPVPVSINQGDDSFTLTLHNTTAQTDTIRLDDDPLIKRLDWQQTKENEIAYTFQLKTDQQWGYDLRYEGTSLILALRHPPKVSTNKQLPLSGMKILLDPGHGGEEKGAKGSNGYPEKTINLLISKQLEQELSKLGATVVLTRTKDVDLGLRERMDMIQEIKPDLAFSIHYNALPDNGDAENTQGISTFWYHPQAHDLAISMHDHLVTSLDRPSYGVFWNNLALSRPQIAPTVLLELGFMINPWEFEWITDQDEQKKLVKAIAEGIVNWVEK